MPSQARTIARDKMLPEIDRILEAHSELRRGKRGPDPHNAILKSGLVMLCATWELYCEEVLLEATDKLSRGIKKPKSLPESVKAELRLAVHDENVHRSNPLRLAGNGWRKEYRRIVEDACRRFNTPKPEGIDSLFKKFLGIRDISKKWSNGPDEIEEFVTFRGEIAHRGSDARPVSKDALRHYKAVVSKSITETDDAVYDLLKTVEYLNKAPWQRTNK